MLLRVNFCTFVHEIKSEIENRKLKIEDYGKVHDLRFSNSVFRCDFAALEAWPESPNLLARRRLAEGF